MSPGESDEEFIEALRARGVRVPEDRGGRGRQPWVRMRIDLDRDPVVLEVAAALRGPGCSLEGVPQAVAVRAVIGSLVLLWGHVRAECVPGPFMPGATVMGLDLAGGLEGLVTELGVHGWLVVTDQGARFHDPHGYIGCAADERDRARMKKRLQRGKSQ